MLDFGGIAGGVQTLVVGVLNIYVYGSIMALNGLRCI